MSHDHPIAEVAERFGRLTSQFEPGTTFYQEVVQITRNKVDSASTRDDLEDVIADLEMKLRPHFTDDQMDQFGTMVQEMRTIGSGWPVDAFKDGYRKGTGEQLPDEGTVAGRSLGTDREQL